MATAHLRICLTVSIHFLFSSPAFGQQQIPALPEEHLMVDVWDSTTYADAPAFYTSRDFYRHHSPTTSFASLKNADLVKQRKEKGTRQIFLEHSEASTTDKTAPPCQHLGTDLPQGPSAETSTDHGNIQQRHFAETNTIMDRNSDAITLPVNNSRIQTSSFHVLPSTGDTQLTSQTKNNSETNLSSDTNPESDDADQENSTPVYVQLGTEWIPKCLNDKFCYQKCKQPYSHMNRSTGSIHSTGDDVSCSKDRFYGQECSCDHKCIIYGDCCPDVFLQCWNISDIDTVINVINNTRSTLLLNASTDDLVHRLSLEPDNSEAVLDNVYIQFGTCRKVRSGVQEKSTLFISRCPANAKDSLKSKCETNVSPLLPPASARLGSVDVDFSNVHCALCHGVKAEQLTPFSVRIECLSSLADDTVEEISLADLLAFIDTGLCNVTYTDRSRPCVSRPCREDQVVSDRDQQLLASRVELGECHQADALLCSSYFYPYDGFRNPHCKKCLATNSRTTSEVNAPQAHTPHNGACALVQWHSNNLLGGIFLFLDVTGTYFDPKGTVQTKYICQDDEVLDVLTQECKLLVCAAGHQAYRGMCQPTHTGHVKGELGDSSVPTWTTLRMVVVTSTTQISCHNFSSEFLHQTAPDLIFNSITVRRILDSVVNVTSQDMSDHNNNNNNNGSRCTDDYEHVTSDTANRTSVEALIALQHDLDLATLSQLKQLAQSINGEEIEANITSTDAGQQYVSLCENANIYSPLTSTELQGRVYVFINSTGTHRYYLLQSVGYELRISRTKDELQMVESAVVCEVSRLLSRMECAVITYRLNETMVNSSGLYFLASGQLYTENDFEIKDDLVYVCSKLQFTASLDKLTASTVGLILNMVFSSISILFLLSMVIIYCVFPSLRTLAGKMTASLAGTMGLVFASNMLSFIETHNKYACPVVAVASHVALLAQFGWMSAIAVNMALTFGPSSLSHILFRNSNAHFRTYNFLVYGVSVSVVLVSGVLDVLHDDHQLVASPCPNKTLNTNLSDSSSTCKMSRESFDYPRYGYPVCSWFSGPLWTRLAFVLVPFAISYLINIICFIVTLVGIHTSSKLTKKLGKTSSERVQCVIYIKLSTAMGFTWMLSLLRNILPETESILYTFTVFILLQGVFLFLAFMANTRVLALIRGRLNFAGRSEQTRSGLVSRSRLYTSSQD